jgi:hypothetical protein
MLVTLHHHCQARGGRLSALLLGWPPHLHAKVGRLVQLLAAHDAPGISLSPYLPQATVGHVHTNARATHALRTRHTVRASVPASPPPTPPTPRPHTHLLHEAYVGRLVRP